MDTVEVYVLIPVGVPKTPYRLPGAEDATWVDMYNVLYRERLLFLITEVQDEIAGQICGIISNIQLEEEEDDITPINVVISSPGGSLYPGFAIYDCLVEATPPVVTWCIGMAASMASVVLLGGDLTQRLMSENARIMVHQPAASYFMASASECALESGEILRMRELITRTYRIYTGRTLSQLSWMLERDCFLDAKQSHALGLVDEICHAIPDEFWGRHNEGDDNNNGASTHHTHDDSLRRELQLSGV